MIRSAALIGAALTLAATAARADAYIVATVSASYDTTFGSPTFTVTNTSGVALTDVVLFSPYPVGPNSVDLGALDVGASVSYEFNQNSGAFETDPSAAYLDDATQYGLAVSYSGTTDYSALFSPASNLSGNYVDFLGNCLNGAPSAPGGCISADGSATLVGQVVPEPASLALLGLGVSMTAAGLRRRRA